MLKIDIRTREGKNVSTDNSPDSDPDPKLDNQLTRAFRLKFQFLSPQSNGGGGGGVDKEKNIFKWGRFSKQRLQHYISKLLPVYTQHITLELFTRLLR